MQNFNPYAPFQPQTPPQYQPPIYNYGQQYQQTATPQVQIAPGISGKIVNDFNEITIKDIPTDCSPAFFIKSDYSEIQSRRWSDTGSVIPVTYRAVEVTDTPKIDPFQQLNNRLDEIEALLNKKPVSRKKEDET